MNLSRCLCMSTALGSHIISLVATFPKACQFQIINFSQNIKRDLSAIYRQVLKVNLLILHTNWRLCTDMMHGIEFVKEQWLGYRSLCVRIWTLLGRGLLTQINLWLFPKELCKFSLKSSSSLFNSRDNKLCQLFSPKVTWCSSLWWLANNKWWWVNNKWSWVSKLRCKCSSQRCKWSNKTKSNFNNRQAWINPARINKLKWLWPNL